ncbi:glycosyltransferase family 4 protein [Phycicoccus sp. 3266]|uniref:glycosyltransferase family 4 protein n=1 Tax=Phycicoccus sp. 3266 TaxID=2817751 RepID=UPI00286375ED|nr:glycosyltransferase family 4 protein [Phycicoccus sp. 3266]MDR6862579.1 glycosyltransferase involved in cell wall biosynthesis [Phycicoccus sp. 3266]
MTLQQPRDAAAAAGPLPLVVAMVARERGITGVHTHVRQLRRYLDRTGTPAELVTPHSWVSGTGDARSAGAWWRRLVLAPAFGARVVLERVWGPGNVWWYRTSHEVVLRSALRQRLAGAGPCVVYAQCPVSARAALAARTGPEQRVVLAVHFRISQADEWADKGQVHKGGPVYRWIRATEREVVPAVDGIVFVSRWARDVLRAWLPAVDTVPGTVIPNFVDVTPADSGDPDSGDSDPGPESAAADPGAAEPLAARDVEPAAAGRTADLVSVGNLEAVKNHRYLLRVLAAARALGHDYTLDVFGQGVERGNLLALARELGVSDLLRLPGFQPDVQQRLPGYRAYVHASYSESSSLAIMEAMAAGLPVVSVRENALGELFVDPDEGRFWPLDDAEEAARVLVDLLEDDAEVARAGAAARAAFLDRYDAEVVAPRLVRFLLDGAASEVDAGLERVG